MPEPIIWNNTYAIANICGKADITALMLDSVKNSYNGEIEFLFTPKDDLNKDDFANMIKARKFPLHDGMCDSETGARYEYDEKGIIIKTKDDKSERNPAYHTAFSRMLWKACNSGITWFLFLESDIILNTDFMQRCLDAHKRAKLDRLNVGAISPLDWNYDWYNKGVEGFGYVEKEWFTTHCVILHRDVLIRGIDLTKPYWHDYNFELDKYIGKDLSERGYVNICATPSRAFSTDGQSQALVNYAEDKAVASLVEQMLKIEVKKQIKLHSGEQTK